MHTALKAAGSAVAVLGIITSLAGAAAAADLGYGQPYSSPRLPIDQSPRYAAPSPIWQGLYVGANLGYGFGRAVPNGTGSDGFDVGGLTGGLHAGYNWQFGNVVTGLEIDGSLGRIDGSRTYSGPASLDATHDWLSSARVRLGYAFDNVLVYGTGGIGYGGLSAKLTPASGAASTVDQTQFGYVVGAGVEMKLTSMISGRIEALHYGFGEETFKFTSATGRIDSDVTTVRAGISMHLN